MTIPKTFAVYPTTEILYGADLNANFSYLTAADATLQDNIDALSPILIQDYTTVGNIGESNQQKAGHIWSHTDLNTLLSNWSTLAYYKFANGALVTDDVGAYNLTDHGTITNTTGILNTNYAASFNGSSQYFTQPTLLDTMPSNISVFMWVKPSDGQSAASQYLLYKEGSDTNNKFSFYIDTDGSINYSWTISSTTKVISSVRKFPNGTTDWFFIGFTHDTINGVRLWVNGNIQGCDPTATTLVPQGTTTDLFIGCYKTPSNYFGGSIAQVILSNSVVTYSDIDFLMSIKIAEPIALQGKNYNLLSKMKKNGAAYIIESAFASTKCVYNNYIYIKGYCYGATDKLALWGGLI